MLKQHVSKFYANIQHYQYILTVDSYSPVLNVDLLKLKFDVFK